MRSFVGFTLILMALTLTGCASVPKEDLSYLYLEEVRGEQALQWVESENQRTLQELGRTEEFSEMEKQALQVLEAKDNLPYGSLRGGFIYNFWRDDKNIQGLWRRTPLASYKTGRPQWENLLSLDQMKAEENIPWVYKGVHCQPAPVQRCLVRLSSSGKDAVEVREFDLQSKQFVADGFHIPEAKSSLVYKDHDTLLVATDFGEGTLSRSGYPLVVKHLKRGQPLEAAEEVFRASKDDMGVFVGREDQAEGSHVYLSQLHSFQNSTTYILGEGFQKLPLPLRHEVLGVLQDQLLFSIKDPQQGFAPGSILSLPLKNLSAEPALVFEPTDKESLRSWARTQSYLLLDVNRDVKLHNLALRFEEGHWVTKPLQLGAAGVDASVMASSYESDEAFFVSSGFLSPPQVHVGSIERNKFESIYSLPQRFTPQGLRVEQHFATSKDGTKVPYYIVFPKNQKSPTATLLYGYGGFEVSLSPSYLGVTGKLWLEKGGAYAVANIRGGGEYGPRWHQAALKLNRHKAYEDFFAVAEDMIQRGYTTSAQLGIDGGSNGGLLTGVALTQRPELFGGVISSVPLLDMLRYHKLLAGPSWMDEYGNPEVAKERRYLESYSPFHNVKPEGDYPPLLLITSTEDDRVHPAHARKMAHRMKDQGHRYFYYENTRGGHGAADLRQRARLTALKFSFLKEVLKKGPDSE